MYANVSQGDTLVMINGMAGTVASFSGDTLEVEFTGRQRIRFKRWAIKEINGKDIPK